MTGADADLTERVRVLEAALAEANAERAALWDERNRRVGAEQELASLRKQIAMMEASPSWRVTAPLRQAKAKAVRVRTLAKTAQARLRGG